ncbi:MAG: glycerate kinase [Bacteroidota bacterium]
MHILIAPDKFKGSLEAQAVALAVEQGLRSKYPDAKMVLQAMSDGGDGSIDILEKEKDLRRVDLTVNDPLFRPVETYYFRNDTEAYIDFSIASGWKLLDPSDRNPMHTTSLGTGKQIEHAIEHGVSQINLFIGGSATNDAAIGIGHALGHRFYDRAGQILTPVGGNLVAIDRIELADLPKGVQFQVICDVTNPFFGPFGAAHVYARQKGANDREISILDNGLRQINTVFARQGLPDVSQLEGAGAAGGTGGGMKALFNATLIKGFDWFCDQLDMETKLRQADLVITGEGQLDASSLHGKVVGGFARLCQKWNTPLVVVCGINQLDPRTLKSNGIVWVDAVVQHAQSEEDAMRNTSSLLKQLCATWELGHLV